MSHCTKGVGSKICSNPQLLPSMDGDIHARLACTWQAVLEVHIRCRPAPVDVQERSCNLVHHCIPRSHAFRLRLLQTDLSSVDNCGRNYGAASPQLARCAKAFGVLLLRSQKPLSTGALPAWLDQHLMAAENGLMNRTFFVATAPQRLRTRISGDVWTGLYFLESIAPARLKIVSTSDVPLKLFGAWNIETTALAAAVAFMVRPPIRPVDYISRSK